MNVWQAAIYVATEHVTTFLAPISVPADMGSTLTKQLAHAEVSAYVKYLTE